MQTLADFRKISLRQMAKKLGISHTYLYDIEKGNRTPSDEVYEKMLKEYGEIMNTYFYCRIVPVVTRRTKEELDELIVEK